jgi:hypothetical protein
MPPKKSSNKVSLTCEQEELLISLVQARPSLYDKKEKTYKNKNVREANWEEIGLQMTLQGIFCSFILIYLILKLCFREGLPRSVDKAEKSIYGISTKIGKSKWHWQKSSPLFSSSRDHAVLERQRGSR